MLFKSQISALCSTEYSERRLFKIAYKVELGVFANSLGKKKTAMFLYIKVNTLIAREIAQLSIKKAKYDATYCYKLDSLSKIHWSKVIQ